MVRLLTKLFDKQINSITVAAILVAGSSLVSRLLGVFRDRILAGEFGAGDTLDIYYAAFRIPDLVFNLLVLGALSAGFIPLFTGLVKDEKDTGNNKQAWSFANNLLNIMIIGLLILILILEIVAPVLTKLITPGFSDKKLELTVALTRIMFFSPLLLGISSVFSGILQSFKRFFVYSLSPIFYNIGIIIGALFFVPFWGIYGLAWGVVLGAFMHLVVQLPLVFRMGYRYGLQFKLKDEMIKRIGRLMVPRTLSLAITQVNLVVITIIASTLESGSLTIFNFANNLQSFPVGIFGISFAVAAFPALSNAARNPKKIVEHFSGTLRQILFFIVPFSVIIVALRAQIVRAVLGTGAFTWEDTILTMDTLGYFMIGLFAQATIPLLVRMFYARQNSKTPFYIGLFAIAVNIALSLWLPKVTLCNLLVGTSGLVSSACLPLGVKGLALAFSISSILNFVLLWYALKKNIGALDGKHIVRSTLKFIFAASIAALVVQGMKEVVWPYIDMTKTWGIIFQGGVAGALGLLVYAAVCSLLQSEELLGFWESFKRRMLWKKIEAGDQGEARGI